ncbi:MAG: hydrogenase maturation nickel metallochaperone HypA [Holophagaceae bacterium]
MHELSLMEELLRIAEAEALARGGRVETVVLEAGRLAGVEVEALRFAFEALKAGTAAEGAALEIEEPEGRGWCEACREVQPLETRFDPCPRCGAAPLALVGGRELRLKALDLVT